VGQIGLSLVLLVAAGLFGRSLGNLHSINLGFPRDQVLLFTVAPRVVGYEGPALTRLYSDLQQRLQELPGVVSASLSARALPAGGGTMAPVSAAGLPPPPRVPGQRPPNAAGLFPVGPAFFETMRIPLVAGREFDGQDIIGGVPVAVINQRLARVLGLAQPIGARITLGERTLEVIGVVGDALYINLKDDLGPMIYLPYEAPGQMTYEVRTATSPLSLAGAVRQVVRQLDARLAVFDMTTQAEYVDRAISQEIALARLCLMFAALALVIACVGLYGLVAFNVARQTREIGIRMALGARPARVVWRVLRSVLVLEIVGLIVGIPVAWAGARYAESLLFEIEPGDPTVLALAVMALLMTGLVAGLVPARRAARVDPVLALRNE
jgi:predicted permease